MNIAFVKPSLESRCNTGKIVSFLAQFTDDRADEPAKQATFFREKS